MGEPQHLVDLVEEDVTTSLENIVRVLLLALEVQHGQVLVSRPVDVLVIEDNAIGRDSVDSRDGFESHLVLGEVLVGDRHNSVQHRVLTELGLDLLLVCLEGLVNSSVGGSQRGIPLEHDAVSSHQGGD